MPLQHTVKEVELKNGAKGLFILTPGATAVRYATHFRAGNDYAKRPEISQVAHILEHMAFGANTEYPSIEAFSHEFTKNGAYSNAFTSNTGLWYEADAGAMEWDRIMNLQRLAVTHPLYSEELLEAEKSNVREEITGYANATGRILWQTVMQRAGLDRWFDADEIKTIDAVTLDDIKEHFERTHTTQNMRFIIAGDLEAHMPGIIEQFEGWELPSGALLPVKPETAVSTGLVHIYRGEMHNIDFSLKFFLNRILNRKELRAMSILGHILTDTFHSRIWGPARARGLAYGLWSWTSTNTAGTSDFSIGTEVSLENAEALFQLIIKELNIVASEGVGEEELRQAKQYRLGAMQMGQDTVKSLVSWYDERYYETDEIDYLDNMPALIEGTTVKEIKDLAHEFIHSGIWSFGAIGKIAEEDLQKHYDLFANKLMGQ